MLYHLDPLVEKIRAVVESHRLAPGAYRRWNWKNAACTRNLDASEYGCADAANILYTIGDFPESPEERAAFVAQLRAFQHADTGLFTEPTHHTLHATAHCTAALELFDALPLYPLTGLDVFRTREGLTALLDGLDWVGNPWSQAHQGAGVFAALINTRCAPLTWQNDYFAYLDAVCDPKYGMSYAGAIDAPGSKPLCHHLFGWFHYLFNYAYARRPFPHAEALLDTCIGLYRTQSWDQAGIFGRAVNFREIDWVFTVHRAAAQTGCRFGECKALLRDFAARYLPYLDSLDWARDEGCNDLHMLFGAVCALAELQLALPGEIVSTRPLKNVLDRRPFI